MFYTYDKLLILLLILGVSACSAPREIKQSKVEIQPQRASHLGGTTGKTKKIVPPPVKKESLEPDSLSKKEDKISEPPPNKTLHISPENNKNTPVSDNRAVLALVGKAQQKFHQGNKKSAAASIERALRIEPRNAKLWQQLAVIRLQQKKYRQAEQLAKKSNHFTKKNRYLQIQNWDIIARACTGYDNIHCAAQAYKKIQFLQEQLE